MEGNKQLIISTLRFSLLLGLYEILFTAWFILKQAHAKIIKEETNKILAL
jgi:hypothetical protein